MKLAKALKLKNKKVNEHNETIARMLASNSYDIDSKKVYNASELYNTVKEQAEDLVKLKTAIHVTSEPIRKSIFTLSEFKSLLSNIQRLNTTEGPIKQHSYAGNNVVTFKSDIDELAKRKLIENIQNQIDNLQEEIDLFNATTELVGY